MENSLDDSYMKESNKLDGSNYVKWKLKIQTFMEGENVWSITYGKESKPKAFANSIQYWDYPERKVKVFPRIFVKDNIIHHIRYCNTFTHHSCYIIW